MGKAIGSGLPVAAVLGTESAFAAVEDGRAPRAGTYHGNPLVCAAVLATLATLRAADYPALLARGNALRARIADTFAALGEPGCTSGTGSVFSIWRSATPPRTYAQARVLADPAFATALHLELRRQGVVTIPGNGWGRWFLSFAHDDATLDAVARAFAAALPRALRP
jgi:glutamate-1-semialdehyde 2,1-aminomutase